MAIQVFRNIFSSENLTNKTDPKTVSSKALENRYGARTQRIFQEVLDGGDAPVIEKNDKFTVIYSGNRLNGVNDENETFEKLQNAFVQDAMDGVVIERLSRSRPQNSSGSDEVVRRVPESLNQTTNVERGLLIRGKEETKAEKLIIGYKNRPIQVESKRVDALELVLQKEDERLYDDEAEKESQSLIAGVTKPSWCGRIHYWYLFEKRELFNKLCPTCLSSQQSPKNEDTSKAEVVIENSKMQSLSVKEIKSCSDSTFKTIYPYLETTVVIGGVIAGCAYLVKMIDNDKK